MLATYMQSQHEDFYKQGIKLDDKHDDKKNVVLQIRFVPGLIIQSLYR